jgi:hypothetical protein
MVLGAIIGAYNTYQGIYRLSGGRLNRYLMGKAHGLLRKGIHMAANKYGYEIERNGILKKKSSDEQNEIESEE